MMVLTPRKFTQLFGDLTVHEARADTHQLDLHYSSSPSSESSVVVVGLVYTSEKTRTPTAPAFLAVATSLARSALPRLPSTSMSIARLTPVTMSVFPRLAANRAGGVVRATAEEVDEEEWSRPRPLSAYLASRSSDLRWCRT